jgi:RimJ/RimL family protein N-acetyltransferase
MKLPKETARLRLRRFGLGDADALRGYRSDPRVARLQSWTDMSVDEAEALIADRTSVGELDRWAQVAIALKESDELIGDIGVCVRSPGDVAEIGFSMAPAAQGHGYATEACRAVIADLFATTNVRKVVAIIDARNEGAIALVRRLGMMLEATEEAEFKGERCVEHQFYVGESQLAAVLQLTASGRN